MGLSQSRSRTSNDDVEHNRRVSTEGLESKGLVNVEKLSERKGQIAVNSRYIYSRCVEEDYKIEAQVLGSGASGPVKLAKDQHGVMYAVKSFKVNALAERKRTELIREVSMCLVLDHPHIVRLERVYETDQDIHLIMEFMAGGELYSRLLEHEKYSEDAAARATRQMLLAVSYLHSNKVVHRDLKLENFLYELKEERERELGAADHLKLIDFGFAKIWDGSRHKLLTQSCGTPSYVAPEVLKHQYTEKADLWSLGVIVYMLLTGRALFIGNSDREVLRRVQDCKPHWSRTFFEPLSMGAKDFVKSLIVESPEERMSAKQALEHPWLNSAHSQQTLHINDDVLQSLRRFAHASRFRRACLSMMAWSLSQEDRQELRNLFMSLDNEKTGTLTLHEFKEAFQKSYEIDSLEAQDIFEGLDVDGDQEISYSEFLAAAMHDHVRMHNDVLLKTFRRFDSSGRGRITVEDLREVLGDSFEGSDVQDLLREADFDNDGQIMYEEFLEYLHQQDLEEEELEEEDLEEEEETENAGVSSPIEAQPVMTKSVTMSLAEAYSQNPGLSPKRSLPFGDKKNRLLFAADRAISRIITESPDEELSPQPRPILRRRCSAPVRILDDRGFAENSRRRSAPVRILDDRGYAGNIQEANPGKLLLNYQTGKLSLGYSVQDKTPETFEPPISPTPISPIVNLRATTDPQGMKVNLYRRLIKW